MIEKLADPATRIVSLTVTEGVYNIDLVSRKFDADNPAVAADLQPDAVPRTVFGLITEGLARRRHRGVPAFTIISCDNIQGNGHLAQRVFTTFARLRDPELGEWVAERVRFPNSMVDRITPVTTDADKAMIATRYGIDNGWPVLSEPFAQWALQDDFAADRPPLEDVGSQLVPDVEPYAGGDVTRSAAVVASWACYAEGVDEQGNPIEVVDKLSSQLTAAAHPADPGRALRPRRHPR